MTIQEVHDLIPGAEVYSLDPESRYLIVVKTGSASTSALYGLSGSLSALNIPHSLISVYSPATDLKVFELEPQTIAPRT